MPDLRVISPAPYMDVPTAAAACAEIMHNHEVTADIKKKYQLLKRLGLTDPITGGVPHNQILQALTELGKSGFEFQETFTTGVIYLKDPYPLPVADMINYLSDGARPFMLYCKLEDGSSRLLTVRDVERDESGNVSQLVCSEMDDESKAVRLINPTFAIQNGYLAFAYRKHDPRLHPTVYDEWRIAKLDSGEDPRSKVEFQGHVNNLANIDGGSRDIYERGFPDCERVPIQVITPPAPEVPAIQPLAFGTKAIMKGIQVWQNVPASQAAGFCANTGLNTVCVKALDGVTWMSNFSVHNPGTPSEVANMRKFYNDLGLQFGIWTNPRANMNIDRQAELTIQAAMEADFLVMDVEPYGADFWGAWQPEGLAQSLMQQIREGLGWQYPIAFQPDPRPGRFEELRPAEWMPYMTGYMPQNYWEDFQTTSIVQATLAVEQWIERMPTRALVPTFPSRLDANPLDMSTAVGYIREHGASGFMIWRFGICSERTALAAVSAWE